MAQKKDSGRKHERTGSYNKNTTSTKKGPGRIHKDGQQKAKNRKK